QVLAARPDSAIRVSRRIGRRPRPVVELRAGFCPASQLACAAANVVQTESSRGTIELLYCRVVGNGYHWLKHCSIGCLQSATNR
ncbi:MAG: hypothetical protein KDA51_04280, partial [Planctomycetales bacterium]|nr:hypothetical protein [Planctomycetales bacterium]